MSTAAERAAVLAVTVAEQDNPTLDMLTADLLGEDWHLPRLVQPAPVADIALRDGKDARPDNVHIPTTKRWRLT